MNVEELLDFEEGFSAKPYIDSLGYPTIGNGTLIGPKGAPLSCYTLEVSREVAHLLLKDMMSINLEKLRQLYWYENLDEDKQMIIQSMAYQLGMSGLLKFKNMIKALTDKNYSESEKQALDSLWAKQTPARAKRHATVLGGKSINEVYK